MYEIIPDKELSVDTLLNSKNILFTESEIQLYKKTPWTWHLLSGENVIKNTDYYLNAGYDAFVSVMALDDTVRHVLKELILTKGTLNKETLNLVPLEDLHLENKIKRLDALTKEILELPLPVTSNVYSNNILHNSADANNYGVIKSLYDLKMCGFKIAESCVGNLLTEQYSQNVVASILTQNKYPILTDISRKLSTGISSIKGSYVNYIESNKTSNIPKDIDLVLSANINTIEKYYSLIIKGLDLPKIDDTEISLILIPHEYLDGYTFFDLDVNKKSVFIQANRLIQLNNHPEKIVGISGNIALEKLRQKIPKVDKIKALFDNPITYRKVQSMIRQPERFYKKLDQVNLSYLVSAPIDRKYPLSKDLSSKDLQKMLAAASIELSQMNLQLYSYFENKIENNCIEDTTAHYHDISYEHKYS